MREYFDVRSRQWSTTVKWSIVIGFGIGLIAGANVLLRVL